MLGRITDFFRTGSDRPPFSEDPREIRRLYERRRWSVFLSVTLGYGVFYVCRLNFAAATKPLLDEGLLSGTEIGLIGSVFFVVYAVGKLVNGFLADRSNIRRFMSTGLLGSALVSLVLGFNSVFLVFALLWGVSGWFQSAGSAPSVVALSHWFSKRERGTRYGIWSMGHSIGEGLTFVGTAMLVSALGWRWGFWGPGLLGIAAALVLFRTLADRPQTYGLPRVAEYRQDFPVGGRSASSVGATQRDVLRNWAVWVLGLSSACMYVARYGMNNFGMLYLQTAKGYTLVESGTVLGMYPTLALIGASTSGLLSDRLFGSRRNVPALLYGLLELGALAGFFLVPPGYQWADMLLVAVFGFALGGLLVFLGGLMAVDICSQRAAGAAMGVVGLFSYLGAAIQNTVSGVLIDAGTTQLPALPAFPCLGSLGAGPADLAIAAGNVPFRAYELGSLAWFWVGASVLSLLFALTIWRVKARD